MADRFHRAIPDGEDRERLICTDCGFIAYENPKVVVGAVVVEAGQILLCRRAIAPRAGYWTLPAGYLELGETAPEGAVREVWEEAQARVRLEGLLAVYSIARIGQVQLLFRAHLAEPGWSAGPESLEVGFFTWEKIPWGEIAFPSVRWALRHWYDTREHPLGAPATNPIEDPRGTRPLPTGTV